MPSHSEFDDDIAAAYGDSNSEPGIDSDVSSAYKKGLQDMLANAYLSQSNALRAQRGAIEAPISMLTSSVATPVAGLTGVAQGLYNTLNPNMGMSAADRVEKTQEALTYHPRTEVGKQALGLMSYPFAKLSQAGNYLGENTAEMTGSPLLGSLVNAGFQVGAPTLVGKGVHALGGRFGVPDATVEDTQALLNNAYGDKSMGAASTAPDITTASPELRAKIEQAVKGGLTEQGKQAISRHAQAESLPVPVELTKGQATGDLAQLSDEFNLRRAHPELADRFNEQNGKLIQNVQALRDQVGPDVFSTDNVTHADRLIEAYKAKDEAVKADISAKYQALKDANGGDFPIDGIQFVDNADKALKENMKAPFLPSGVRSILNGLRDGEPMTFENFENLRTMLAAEARKAERSGDGNASAAVSMVRDQLEKLPLTGGAENLKPLADQARSAAKARFDALKADPAYKAAVNDTTPPDQFIKKFVIGGTRDNVSTMRQNLSHDPVALQTMSVAALDHLRDSAGIDPRGVGNFSQAGFKRALDNLSPKANSLFAPQTIEHLENLRDVAGYTTAQPRGSSFNNSNTAVALLGDKAASLAEHGMNAAMKGFPVGTIARNALGKRAAARSVKEALEPGAGITE